jgi:ATP-dependent DNA ligase
MKQMLMSDFAEKMESYLDMTPTQIINSIVADNDLSKDWAMFYHTLTDKFSSVGLGAKNLLPHIADELGLEEEGLQDLVDDFGGVPELLEEFGIDANKSIDYCLFDAFNPLAVAEDIVTARQLFMERFRNMNKLEKKWYTAVVINQKRNGAGDNVTKKSLQKKYLIPANDFKTALKFNNLNIIIDEICVGNGVGELMIPEPGSYVQPQLAKTAKKLQGTYYADVKYDGIRAQFHRDENGHVCIFNRKGVDITEKFADLDVQSWGEEYDEFILDGEIVPIDDEGNVLEFKEIMPRIHGKTPEVRNRVAVKAIIFDILTFNKQDTYNFGYGNRLDTIRMHFPNVNITDTKVVNGEEEIREAYNKAIKDGFEGLVLKGANQVYEPGKRSWLKHKPALVDLDCEIMDATMGSGKRAGHYGSYLIGVRIDGELTPVGSVGTGFTEDDLRLVHEYHDNNVVTIMEVHADIVTQDQEGNIGLRFPRFIRLRTDKDTPSEFKSVKELVS